MRYIPIEDEQAELVERAARSGKTQELVELLKLVEEKRASLEDIVEHLKKEKPWDWEPRVKEIESKVAELASSVKEVGKSTSTIEQVRGKLSELGPRVDKFEDRFELAVSRAGWKRDDCEHYDGTKCTLWRYEERPSGFKTIKDGKVWRVLVKEQPEYCASCADFKDKQEPSVNDRLSVATRLARWKRDKCVHYDGTKCTFWHVTEEPPPQVLKPIKDGKLWRVNVKEQPEYCIPCPKFKEKVEK